MQKTLFILLFIINNCFGQTTDTATKVKFSVRMGEFEHFKKVNNPTINAAAVMNAFLANMTNRELGNMKYYFTQNFDGVKSEKIFLTKTAGEKVLFQEIDFNENAQPIRIYTLSRTNHLNVTTLSYSGKLLKEIKEENGKVQEVRYDDDKMILVTPEKTEVYFFENNTLLKKEYSYEAKPDGKFGLAYAENRLEDKCNKFYQNDKLLYENCFPNRLKQIPYYIKYTLYQDGVPLPTNEMKIDSADAYHYKTYYLKSDDKKKSIYALFQDIYLNDQGLFLHISSRKEPALLEYEYEYYH